MIQSKRYFFIILILLSYQVCTSQVHANSNSDRVDYLIELLQEPLDTESQKEIKGAIIRIWKLSKSEEIQQKMNKINHQMHYLKKVIDVNIYYKGDLHHAITSPL